MIKSWAAQRIGRLPLLCVLAVLALLAHSQRAGSGQVSPPAPVSSAGYSEKGADTCLSCHNDERMLIIFRTAHGQGNDPNTPFAHLQCESCHGPGGEHAGRRNIGAGHPPVVSFGRDKKTPADEQSAVCLDCHTQHVGMEWTGSAHQRNAVSCVDCHSAHAAVDRISELTEQAEVCYACHPRQRADGYKPYAHPVREGIMTCTSCHESHRSINGAMLKRNNLNELCWSCHTELRGPFLFEHAPVPEDCSLCHYPHGSIHPALLNRRVPLLCQACHSQRGHPSVSYTTAGLPGRNSPSVFVAGGSCLNCHRQVHGSNHPSGVKLMR